MILLHDERNEVFGMNENQIVWFFSNKKFPRPATDCRLERTVETNATIKTINDLEFDVAETVDEIVNLANNKQIPGKIDTDPHFPC